MYRLNNIYVSFKYHSNTIYAGWFPAFFQLPRYAGYLEFTTCPYLLHFLKSPTCPYLLTSWNLPHAQICFIPGIHHLPRFADFLEFTTCPDLLYPTNSPHDHICWFSGVRPNCSYLVRSYTKFYKLARNTRWGDKKHPLGWLETLN